MDYSTEKKIKESKTLIFQHYASRIKIENFYYLFIVHLTKTIEPYLRILINNFNTIGIISVPYSEIKSVKINLSRHTNIYSPSNITQIPKLIIDICKKESDKKICLVEIGGYSSKICQNPPSNIIGTVEDTNQGHWNFRKIESNLKYPVLSIAQTDLKKIENKFVGYSIGFSIEKFLRKYFDRDLLALKNILILGYGEIGRGTAKKLKTMLSNIIVYDLDPINTMLARLDGYNITDRESAIGQADIIVGASGQQSIQESDIAYFKNNVLLISASSKQSEFPIKKLRKYLIKEDKFISSYKHGNSEFHIAYQGYPINFIDDSAFGEIFDVIMTSLLLSSNNITLNNLKPGLYDLDKKIQQDVIRKYFELYTVDNHDRIICLEKMRNNRHDAASAIVLSKDKENKLVVLLLKHSKIGKWIPIGGHVERFESPESAVARELEEEINISPALWFDKEYKVWIDYPIIFNELHEKIPAFQDQPPHIHRDFIFITKIDYTSENNFPFNLRGSIKWWRLEDFSKIDSRETTCETLSLMRKLNQYKNYLLS